MACASPRVCETQHAAASGGDIANHRPDEALGGNQIEAHDRLEQQRRFLCARPPRSPWEAAT